MTSAPLAAGGISLRLYPASLPPPERIEELRAQARVAARFGFDGVMTSEHHGGFPGYLPNPLQIAGFALEAMESGWAAPCPLLLPLRPWTQTAEDLAWLHARFPGRIGAGFAVGGLEQDFELAGVPWKRRFRLFTDALPAIVAALRGEGEPPLAVDAAIAACADRPLPLVVAAQSERAVRRAARLGLGLLYDSLQTPDHLGDLSGVHREAGGPAPRILIRRVWLGPPPSESIARQVDFYRSYTSERTQSSWGADELVQAEEPARLAERLAEVAAGAGADALNLRVHSVGVEPARIREQIERIGLTVLPALRERLAAQRPTRLLG